jgi:hypothetical protein
LSNINTDIFQIAQVIDGEYNNKSIPKADQPIGIYKVSKISFNDQTLEIILTVDCSITDLTPRKIKSSGYNDISYDKVSKSNIKYSVLQSIQIKLTDTKNEINDFIFIDPAAQRHESSMVSFGIRHLDPLKIDNLHASYKGELSDSVRNFILGILNEMAAKEQADIAAQQAERLAWEQQRQAMFANRNTPYSGPATQKKEPQTIFGTYAYQQEGFNGQLILSPSNPSTKKMPVVISTVNPDSGNICEFKGTCSAQGGKLLCTNDDVKIDEDNFIEINILQNALEITHLYDICGVEVISEGKYIRKW